MTQTAFRFSDETLAKLDAIAERRAISRTAALRQLIDEADDDSPNLDRVGEFVEDMARAVDNLRSELR